LLVTVNGGQVTVTPTDSTGRTFDAQTYTFSSTPTTSVVKPTNGATLSGTATTLDASASNATSVEFLLTGGSYSNKVICTASLTIYGWLCSWNTTTVPNGSYTLHSEAFNSGGSALSAAVNVTVNNEPAPTTSVLIPANGAVLSGATNLDASASNATSVEFRLFGGGYFSSLIGTARPTIYGWLYNWNTASVTNGSYILASEAFNSAGSSFSSGVNFTVKN
jgi:hypothetical protein